MIEIKCPNCGSTEFDCYDMNSYHDEGIHIEECCCEECDAQFTIKYEAKSIVID